MNDVDDAVVSPSVVDRVRAAVLDLELAPGSTLSERGLEAAFGASRTPIREALMRLETEGLVQRSGRAWRVAPLDIDEIRALAQLREAIETAAVRLTAERLDAGLVPSSALDELDALLARTRPVDDGSSRVRAGGDFHVELARLSGNPLMADAVAGALVRLARTRWLEVRTPEARDRAWAEHAAVVAALREGAGAGAAALVAEHIRRTHERLAGVLTTERSRLHGRGLAIVESTQAPPPHL